MSVNYRESNCNFYSKYETLKLDDFIEDLKLNGVFKAVDFILLQRNKTIFVEVKSYDAFQKDIIDENITKIIKKISDSYFIIKFLNHENIINFKNKTGNRITLVIFICPLRKKEITPDRLIILREILNRIKRKLKLFSVDILIDTEKNELGLFEKINKKIE